jgi:hypothetical protein
MAYLERLRADEAHNRYRQMREQVKQATAVCAGKAVLDPSLFEPMPVHNPEISYESDGSTAGLKDVMYAFASGLYAPLYGRVSTRQRAQHLEPVQRAIHRWNSALTEAYRASVKPAAFNRIFFEGGLWRVFIDRFAPARPDLRERLEAAGDFSKLKKDKSLLAVAAQAHPFLLRTPPAQDPSHSGSHFDAGRFANTVLHIGETELGLTKEDEKEALLANSLPELRRLTLLEMKSVNFVLGLMYDRRRCRYKNEYLTIDDQRPHVGFDMGIIQERIEDKLPDVTGYNHRGCPVIYQTTPYEDHETPVFSVMDDMLLGIYRTTGALRIPELRIPMAHH